MKYSLGFIGCGNMGRAMLAGALNAWPDNTGAHQRAHCTQTRTSRRSLRTTACMALASNRDVRRRERDHRARCEAEYL